MSYRPLWDGLLLIVKPWDLGKNLALGNIHLGLREIDSRIQGPYFSHGKTPWD
jgi:hypothetical protein